ncbi:MAG TPA: SDR family oxidoreductase [Bacteroidales bacterium]|nr:SDR family oxidoreductase [Bacteroidales bacterium]HOX79019.1 SDR family oxidoreductase [Bacteroidales bacterium]HPI86063.1 SDR family oxidoreductase [Bacteroidales bacterium]HPM91920.1 SDR family oxidoreductase [Bacteroidales bacterium]
MTPLTEDIRNEKLIFRNWENALPVKKNFSGGILVTGANSFLGCHVIKALQQNFQGDIHLLVRAPNDFEAVARMQQSFDRWELGQFNIRRFNIHRGDVCLSGMGMNPEEYRRMCRKTRQVIHLAMTPMYHLPYHHFQQTWIPELERMISFCMDKEYPKFLHYTSSYNANFFVTDEDFQSLNRNAWQSGYAGFKWVAQEAIRNASRQGLGSCIYDVPLVLGSERKGICPSHYSIWIILDIFLKTGYFFPFSFRIIPVDMLAEMIVLNADAAGIGRASGFIRPFLEEPVTDSLFARTAANLLGLKEATLETVRQNCINKLRFDFMMPVNFYSLLEKVNGLPPVFPEWYDRGVLPVTPMVFMSNLNRIMSVKKEMIKT